MTVGADKGYDTADFVAECRNLEVTPHVAQNDKRSGGSAIDARTTRHAGYGISQKKRKRIEESFGWLKTIALMRKVRHRGILQGRVGVHLRGSGLQPGADAEPGDARGSVRISQGRGVSAGLKLVCRPQNGPPKAFAEIQNRASADRM